ncbi:MAG: hypothetical protein KKA32_06760 [Actinobacteria bacterium]|nr:hypothetical protein [Actinomycetota bacterium]
MIGEDVRTLRPASGCPYAEAPPQSRFEYEEAGNGERDAPGEHLLHTGEGALRSLANALFGCDRLLAAVMGATALAHTVQSVRSPGEEERRFDDHGQKD